MLCLEMALLTGRYVATTYNDRSSAEWPPHPARLFSALVATHHAAASPDPEERAALTWLEQQGPPAITASEAAPREVVTVFVPVNDTSVVGSFDAQRERVESARLELDAARQAVLAEAAQEPESRQIKALEKRVAQAEKALATAEKNLRAQFEKAVAAKAKTSEAEEKAGASLLPERRGRQPRTFPSVTPEEPTVSFQWPAARPAPAQRAALQRLCERVVRVGHSSSLVALRVCGDSESAPPASWEPDDAASRRLRVPLPGQLERLEQQFALHEETQPRVLPALPQGYRRSRPVAEAQQPCSVFEEDWLVFELFPEERANGGPRGALPVLSSVHVAEGLRAALQHYCEEPLPELLSGHDADGRPSVGAHLALVPLPSVAALHADGHLLGVALVMPRAAAREQRAAVYRAVAAWEDAYRRAGSDEECPELRLTLGRAGVWLLRRLEDGSRLVTLRSATWCATGRGERVWMSATPVALDRNPGELRSRDPKQAAAAFAAAEESLRAACERIGLPRPEHVWVTRSAPLAGGEKVQRFPRFPAQESKPQRVLVHATLRFAEPVLGPVLLGAGRYRGLGLFRPLSVALVTREEADAEGPSTQGEESSP